MVGVALLAGVLPGAARAGVVLRDGSVRTGSGEPLNPVLLVSFNPQPDIPGYEANLDLSDPTRPTLAAHSEGVDFQAIFAMKVDSGADIRFLLPAVHTGDGAGIYTFSAVVGDAASSTFDFTMTLGSNVGVPSPGSFVSFNPQPDIPGYSGDQGFAFSYAGDIDATLAIQVSHDGVPLSFAQVPEPGSLLAMVPAGVLVVRRRRRAG
jgi:hypothetical protein